MKQKPIKLFAIICLILFMSSCLNDKDEIELAEQPEHTEILELTPTDLSKLKELQNTLTHKVLGLDEDTEPIDGPWPPDPPQNNGNTGSSNIPTTFWSITSGKIEMWGGKIETGPASIHTNVRCDMFPGFVVIGGGAWAEYTGHGALLTASYPSSDKKAWVASSKDHSYEDEHSLTVYVIGIKIDGISESELKNYVEHFSDTGSEANHPEAWAHVPSNTHVMTGGGAQVNWSGQGNLLVESRPEDSSTWYVKSKDHSQLSPATITAYAIGLEKNIPGFGTLQQQIVNASSCHLSGAGSVMIDNIAMQDGYIYSCSGGMATYSDGPDVCALINFHNYSNSGYGRMLFQTYGGGNHVVAGSKDHTSPSGGRTYVWGVAIRDPNY